MSPPVIPKKFSNHCVDAMENFLSNQTNQVGSDYVKWYKETYGNTDALKNLKTTDCIIFVFNVLMYGYNKLGKENIAKELNKMPRMGMDLSKFLVHRQDWKAHYWNPDVHNPRDMTQGNPRSEHKHSFRLAHETGQYYGVPLSGMVVGYNKTKTRKYPDGRRALIAPTPTVDIVNQRAFERLKNVKFCVGICKGGMHTFLLSDGKVWEVHYSEIGSSGNLYEKSDFFDYQWLSGIVVTPPDSNFISRPVAEIKAGLR
ncbi:MAG: hypothetical protein LBV29_03565 [Azoarcus sp.]|nr:hypothetical protein [Azoarcus sp.]